MRRVTLTFHSDTNFDHWLRDTELTALDVEMSDTMQRMLVGTFSDNDIDHAEQLGADVME